MKIISALDDIFNEKYSLDKFAMDLDPKNHINEDNDLSADEVYSVRQYNGGQYPNINHYLRTGKHMPEVQNSYSQGKVEGIINNMDSLISKSKTNKPLNIYRGVGTRLNNLQEGDIYTDPAYHSFSLNKEIATQPHYTPSGKYLSVQLPEGSHATFGDRHQSEIILPRGKKYRIHTVHGNEYQAYPVEESE